MDSKKQAESVKRWRRRAIVLGVILGLVCKALPAEYHTVCEAVVTVCTGGL